MQLTGLLVNKERNRNAPGTLTRDTPIWAAIQHSLDSRRAPIWVPANRFNRFFGFF